MKETRQPNRDHPFTLRGIDQNALERIIVSVLMLNDGLYPTDSEMKQWMVDTYGAKAERYASLLEDIYTVSRKVKPNLRKKQ